MACYGKGSRNVRQVVLWMLAGGTSRSPGTIEIHNTSRWSLARFGSGSIRTTSIFVVIDYYSRYYEHAILNRPPRLKVIDSLEEVFSCHRLPVTITLDIGPQFHFQEFHDYCIYNRRNLTSQGDTKVDPS